MKQKHTTWHGAELSPVAIKAGFVDYFAAAEAVNAEYYDINAEDEGTWELVNGDELYFRTARVRAIVRKWPWRESVNWRR